MSAKTEEKTGVKIPQDFCFWSKIPEDGYSINFDFRHLVMSKMWKAYHPLAAEIKAASLCREHGFFLEYKQTTPPNDGFSGRRLDPRRAQYIALAQRRFDKHVQDLLHAPYFLGHGPVLSIMAHFRTTMEQNERRPGGSERLLCWGPGRKDRVGGKDHGLRSRLRARAESARKRREEEEEKASKEGRKNK